LELGKFAGIKRGFESGKGLDGVLKKDENYYNPFLEILNRGDIR
jgi:beta-lysine 5,6-aminomutase alpha subunit